jgi:hypothetical protein
MTSPYSKRNREWLSTILKKCLRVGAIPKAGRCQQCGRDERLDMHHPDYSHPFIVVQLCRLCHSRTHNPKWLQSLSKAKLRARWRAKYKAIPGARINSHNSIEHLPELFVADSVVDEEREATRYVLSRIYDGTRKLGGTNRSQYF